MSTPAQRCSRLPLGYPVIAIALCVFVLTAPVHGYDLTEKLSVGGVLAGTGQCQALDGDTTANDECRGAIVGQPEASFRPTGQDELFVKLGFAMGNGLNKVSPFTQAPWAADIQDDVKNLNTRSRNYLLTAWYKHTFSFGKETKLGLTGGIIDSSDYLDDNAYANDEYTQFMNAAFASGSQGLLQSYDYGGAIEFDAGPFSARGVMMAVGGNDDGNAFTFAGGQLGYSIDNSLGAGNYRLIVLGASSNFLDPTGTSQESRVALGLSFDQQIGETFGAFLRVAWQDDSAVVNYEKLYSGGINILGRPWGRPDDNIGIAYGYLNGGNQDIRDTQVAEIYYRFAVNEVFAVTADAQYMEDNLKTSPSPRGFILGLRGTATF